MARSYKSALPTWSTYTPHVSPFMITPAVNQENIWRNRARQWNPGNIAGEVNRANMAIASMVKGTGMGAHAVALRQHTPIQNALQGFIGMQRSSQYQWAAHQKATQSVDEIDTPAEAPPRTPLRSVNPTNVQTQDAAQALAERMMANAVGSSKAGTTTISPSGIPTRDRRAPRPT